MKYTGCSQCIVHCSNEYLDEDGKYVTSSLEYETIWAMGGMIGVDHLDTIARIDFLCDNIGMCLMVYASLNSPEARQTFLDVTNAKLGPQLALKDMASLGRRILKAEREFNIRAGFTAEDDRLPRFFYEEPLPPHNKVFPFSDEEIDETFDF